MMHGRLFLLMCMLAGLVFLLGGYAVGARSTIGTLKHVVAYVSCMDSVKYGRANHFGTADAALEKLSQQSACLYLYGLPSITPDDVLNLTGVDYCKRNVWGCPPLANGSKIRRPLIYLGP